MVATPQLPGDPTGLHLGDDEPGQADILAQLLRISAILRRRWLVVAVTTAVSVAAAALAITLLQPRWRAGATVVLHMSGPEVLDKIKSVTEDLDGGIVGYDEYYQTQRSIMASRTVAEKALAGLGLADDPVFLGIANIQSEPERVAQKAQIDPVERLRELVDVEEVRNSRIVRISAEYPDPVIAAEISNAVADAYLEYVRTSRSRVGEAARGNLSSERDKAHAELRDSEKLLAEFKHRHAITSVSLEDRQNVITQNILTLSSRVKEAEAARIELEAMYTQAKRLHDGGNIAGATLLPENERSLFEMLRKDQVEAEREFERVNLEFGEKAPEYHKAKSRLDLVLKNIKREASDLLQSLDARLRAAKETEHKLQESLNAEQKNALALSMLEREYRELERETKTNAEAYALVSKRETEIGMTNRVEAENIEILDRATVPSTPVFPKKMLLLALGIVAGMSLGSLLALSIDFRDHRIRGLLDLERALAGFGLPVLGQLPGLPADTRLGAGNTRAQRRQRDLYTFLFPQSLMAERCRGVRTALAFAQGNEPLRTLMITSPSSSEGKSSTAMNLAVSFCQSKKSVILLDADMRRPRIHQVFPPPVEREGVGLAQVLQEKVALEDALIRADEGPDNLMILPCGEPPSNPAELLESPACRRVLAELLELCEVVIIDTPPVLPVTDPVILAGLVDAVCVVARCETTTRGELQRALSQLRQGDTNLLGVVLNEVDTRQERYAYKYGYYTYHARESEPERA